MNLAADIDALEPSPSLLPLDEDADARFEAAPPAPTPPAARRWWFTFDGWRTAEVDTEFVLA